MSGVSLVLDQIPNDYRTPGTYIRVRPNYTNTGLLEFPAHALVVAQMLPTGIAIPLKPYPLYSTAQAVKLGGVGSQAARMAAAWFANNPYTPIDMIFVSDAQNASKATMVVFIGGLLAATPLAIPFRIAGRLYVITLQVGQTHADVQAGLIAAVNNDPSSPVTAAPTSTVVGSAGYFNVTLTAKNAGLNGNAIDVELVTGGPAVLPPTTVAIVGVDQPGASPTQRRASLTGGLGNPDIGSVFAVIASSWYTDILMPWWDTANVSELATELTRRYTATVRQDAYGYVAYPATLSAAIAPGLGSTINCPFLSALPVQNLRTPPEETAAAFAAQCCYRSSQDPALQMLGLVLAGVMPPAAADRFDEQEQNLLLHAGQSTFEVARDGSVLLQRVVSTYTTNEEGAPDTAWLDIMAAKVATRIRWDWRNYVKLQYPSNKLADDGSRAAEYDETIATPLRLKASWVGRTVLYERAGWIENADAINKACTFTRDPNDINRCNSVQPYQRIGNLMLLDVDLQFEA